MGFVIEIVRLRDRTLGQILGVGAIGSGRRTLTVPVPIPYYPD
jgi:hypothetical protein